MVVVVVELVVVVDVVVEVVVVVIAQLATGAGTQIPISGSKIEVPGHF